jgi:hypothetical protein
MITHQAASHLLKRNASWTRWRCVPQEVKTEIGKWVNEELEKQDIPEIREDVFEWRMSRALPDAARAAGKILPEISSPLTNNPANKQQAESSSQEIRQSADADMATQ